MFDFKKSNNKKSISEQVSSVDVRELERRLKQQRIFRIARSPKSQLVIKKRRTGRVHVMLKMKFLSEKVATFHSVKEAHHFIHSIRG